MSRPRRISRAALARAIDQANGNITIASEELRVSKPYLVVLAKHYGLREWARDLREGSGQPLTGRPRGS